MNSLVKYFLILRRSIFIILFVAESFIINYAFAELPINQTNSFPQKESPSSNNNQFNPEQIKNEIKTKQNELAKKLDEIQKELETESSVEIINTLNKQKTLIKNIDKIYTDQLDTIQELLLIETNINHMKEELEKIKTSSPPENPTYLELDNLRDEMKLESGRKDLIDAQIKEAQTILIQAQKNYESVEKVRRQVKKSLDAKSDEAIKQSLSVQLISEQLESQYTEETMHLNELQLRKERLTKDLYNVRLDLYKQKIMLIEKNAVFTKDELQKKLGQLDKEEFDLKELLVKLNVDKELFSKKISFVREKIARSVESDKVLQEQENALELKLNALQIKIDIINLKLDYLTRSKSVWKRRYTVISKSPDRDTLNTWADEAENMLDNLNRKIKLFQLRINDRQKELTTLQNTIEHYQDVSPQMSTWLEDEHNTLEDIIKTLNDIITNCEIVQNLYIKFINEIKFKTSGVRFSLWEWIVKISKSLNLIWDYEIYVYKVGEIEKAYYVKTIFYGLFFLILGFVLSKIVSRFISQLLIQKFEFHEAASSTIEFITYYFLLIMFFLYTLNILNVPLAIFTFFGGAFAIAIGFGSQNILKNFISGLILFIERPVRVGDFIEIDSVIGKVTRIAARSTHIKSFTNLDIILPNSSFLENKFTNWTLKDSVIRSEINIGVSYDSQTEKVEELLLRIVKGHKDILKYPEPICYFINFGDSTLDFVVWYWIDIALSSRFAIDSQVRHTIIKQFRQEGITIAFPQRDIHMDTQAPLDIRILSG
jgi:potassium efflux system protein